MNDVFELAGKSITVDWLLTLNTRWAFASFSEATKPCTANGISLPDSVPVSGMVKENTRVATGGADLPSSTTSRPLKLAVKAFLSSLTARLKPTSLVNFAAWPNAASVAILLSCDEQSKIAYTVCRYCDVDGV